MIDPHRFAEETKHSVTSWLTQMGEGLAPGRFRFCRSRGLVPTSGKRGQGVACFAVKTAWHIGVWQEWPPEVRNACVDLVRSFQTPDGRFVDRWLLRRIDWTACLAMAKNRQFSRLFEDQSENKARTVRAESRQSASTLLMVGHRPKHPLPFEWNSEDSVREFVRSLDWTKPWGAGSHSSHLVAFVVMNDGPSHGDLARDEVLEIIFEETDRWLDERTGAWGKGDVGHVQRINGAMKMLTAYDWAELPSPRPTLLLDYVLDERSARDGCGVLDRLFVANQARKDAPGYRETDLRDFALDAIEEIEQHRQADGGFSYSPRRAQRTYYGACVSLGGRQGDMHGTVLFTLAFAIALDILGIRKELGWLLSKP